MSRDTTVIRPHRPFAWLAALVLGVLPGCSQEPTPEVSAAAETFTPAELESMRKSVKNVNEYRELVRHKRAERAGAGVDKSKPSAKPIPR